MLLRQPFRRRRSQFASLFKMLKAPWILAHDNSFDDPFDHFQDRRGQRLSASPSVRSIGPLHKLTMTAPNPLPFLAHSLMSPVDECHLGSKSLSCALASVAVGQGVVFFRFFAAALVSTKLMPNGVGK
jgi:hypothetical protein